jgi:hypothetical protein
MNPPSLDLDPSHSMTLEKYLQLYPWDSSWKNSPLGFLWCFELSASPEALWPFLSDTSTLNRLLGLSEMYFEEKEGRLHGRSNSLGLELEWEENTRKFVKNKQELLQTLPLNPKLLQRFLYHSLKIPPQALPLPSPSFLGMLSS